MPLCVPLSVVEVSNGTLASSDVLRPGECVSMTVYYLHSVEQTRVEELYEVCSDGIRLRRMKWKSFGAGLPDEYDYYEDGSYVKDTDIDVGRTLSYWLLPLNHVEIRVDGELVVDDLKEPSHVSVSVRRIPGAVWLISALACRPMGA